MATTAHAPTTATPVRELIAELARTEDQLRGCRRSGSTPGQRAARRRQGQILDVLHHR
ncbi:MAG: hypothetical protein ABIU87_02680 [Ornithinibacter sp.]